MPVVKHLHAREPHLYRSRAVQAFHRSHASVAPCERVPLYPPPSLHKKRCETLCLLWFPSFTFQRNSLSIIGLR